MSNTSLQRNGAAVTTSLLLILAGLGYAAYSGFSIFSTQRFIASTPCAEAEVVSVTKARRSGSYTAKRYVTFSVDGEEYAYIPVANAPSSAKKGGLITIHYDPENPRRAAAAEQSYAKRAIGIAAGFAMSGAGAA